MISTQEALVFAVWTPSRRCVLTGCSVASAAAAAAAAAALLLLLLLVVVIVVVLANQVVEWASRHCFQGDRLNGPRRMQCMVLRLSFRHKGLGGQQGGSGSVPPSRAASHTRGWSQHHSCDAATLGAPPWATKKVWGGRKLGRETGHQDFKDGEGPSRLHVHEVDVALAVAGLGCLG